MSKFSLEEICEQCKKSTIVAFKTKDTKEWFTGIVNYVFSPKTEYNDTDTVLIEISLTIPIEPQWYEDQKTFFYLKDIIDLVILENRKNE